MNIIYATTSLEEIKRARAEALKEVPGTKAENCKEVIKEVVLFVVAMIVGCPCICSVLGIPVFHLFTEMGGNRLYMLLGLLMYIVIASVICFIGQRIPLRTPCKSINMINQIFYDETAGIEKAIGQLESMREYVGDGDAVYILRGSEIEIQVQRTGYTDTRTVSIPEGTLAADRGNDTFDYSYLDEMWQQVLFNWGERKRKFSEKMKK